MKTYYKYRPRGEGGTTARLDMRAPGGIIADGHLTFNKKDGSTFLATFEATSAATRKEVLFNVQTRLLFWDGFAIASVIAAIFFAYGYIFDYFTIKKLGALLSIGLVWIVLLSIFFLFRLLFQKLHRYRYIYAVEQFKRYYADDQWVAIGEDVFPNSLDPHLKELKRQCVNYGFGLITVDVDDLEPHLIITPSRNLNIKGRRRISFTDLGAFSRRLAGERKPSFLKIFPNYRNRLRGIDKESTLRFQRTYFNQMLIVGIAWAVIAGLFIKEYEEAEIVYVDEKVYLEEMESQSDSRTSYPEPEDFHIDSMFLGQFKQGRRKTPDKQVQSSDIKVDESIFTEEVDTGLVALAGERSIFDCSRFYNMDGTKYLVLQEVFRDKKLAIEQLEYLKLYSEEVNLLWLGCFVQGSDTYALYWGLFYNSPEEAENSKKEVERLLVKSGMDPEKLSIRSVNIDRG